ncbi:CoA transferase [Herbaspirillum sp. YR522]|uniref:CoA transferase n=1 Tax=Herbaspirillum sp. YR522 TaxID=1144342 RepID=UPI00026FBC8F|nr:CoA transferase [Herbaspirillum sp. YR522]EJM97769.1 putative acyl-CoA transferase/carnitine dehydratase [Herbaspirillum sp. YR522]
MDDSSPSNPAAAPLAGHMLSLIWQALDGDATQLAGVQLAGHGDLPSVFGVSDLAQASIAAAGLAAGELAQAMGGRGRAVRCDRRLASMWFSSSIRPEGWTPPALWDAVAGDYRCGDGWIRLHTNAPHHRARALQVLGLDPQSQREQVASAVAGWRGIELEQAIVDNGGCAAEMRSQAQWQAHPQGQAVASEALVAHERFEARWRPSGNPDPARPLAGVRVLDLTRVLAGPTATRMLAGLGAEVLRIDPHWWDEPGVVPDMTLGKRCARLDLRVPAQRAVFVALLEQADVLVHGYRGGALEGLGLGRHWRRQCNPALVDVALDAYGWSGPWAGRRGFDSLVQMSAGIAHAGMHRLARDQPTPLPVQALDHATGYLMAAAALRGLTRRWQQGAGSDWRMSLARTAVLLTCQPPQAQQALAPERAGDLDQWLEQTAWGPARRLRTALEIDGVPVRWTLAAGPLGSAPAAWAQR